MLAQCKQDEKFNINLEKTCIVSDEEIIYKALKPFVDIGCVFIDNIHTKRYLEVVDDVIADFKRVASPKMIKIYLEANNTFILSDGVAGMDGVRKRYRIIDSKRFSGVEDIHEMLNLSSCHGYRTLVKDIHRLNTFYGYKFYENSLVLYHDTYSVIEYILSKRIVDKILQYNICINESECKMMVSICVENNKYVRIKSKIKELEMITGNPELRYERDELILKNVENAKFELEGLYKSIKNESYSNSVWLEFTLMTPSKKKITI